MARLLHLNGPPGIGKSTLARRWVAEHPGDLDCDIDVLRTLIGGWEQDFAGAGALIRPAALALISAYLGSGHDVVLPQMLMRLTELERFEAAATGVGADFTTVMLLDEQESSIARFHRRGEPDDGPSDPWHDQVRRIVAEQGGDEQLVRCHQALTELLEARPDAVVVRSVEGDADGTYRALVSAVARADEVGSQHG